ncbi:MULTISPECIES: hypothetical protein [unclassified Streptomyces]|uniref:hypothetical protein n=1 Tax=unclassified Streptomyces TaxID=2593676 RepID=UPI0036846382
MDYLLIVAEHLTASQPPSPRNLKYAVLHLQAAAEVLLKARLQLEHWSLVFKDPALANRRKFEDGDFESCTTSSALTRLRQIANIAIDEKSIKAIETLSKSRNALQHYGLKTSARAVESRAAQVLDFLITFVHDQLLPELPGTEVDEVIGDLDYAGEKLRTIRSFMDTRLKRLAGELRDVRHRTLKCRDCDQWGIVVGDGASSVSCHFCHVLWGTAERMLHSWVITEENWLGVEIDVCPDCGHEALVADYVRVAEAPEKRCTLCFFCGIKG